MEEEERKPPPKNHPNFKGIFCWSVGESRVALSISWWWRRGGGVGDGTSQRGHLRPAEEFVESDARSKHLGESFDLVPLRGPVCCGCLGFTLPSGQHPHWFLSPWFSRAGWDRSPPAEQWHRQRAVPVGTGRLHAGRKRGKINQVND